MTHFYNCVSCSHCGYFNFIGCWISFLSRAGFDFFKKVTYTGEYKYCSALAH